MNLLNAKYDQGDIVKRILVLMSLASLCFTAFSGEEAALVCKTKINRKDMQAKVNEVGRIRISGIESGAGMEIMVSVIDNVISKREIEYKEEEIGSVSSEDYDKKIGKFGIKSISSTKAFQTQSYFVYINKKGLRNIEAEVINRETGDRSVLKKCEQSHKFVSRVLKQ